MLLCGEKLYGMDTCLKHYFFSSVKKVSAQWSHIGFFGCLLGQLLCHRILWIEKCKSLAGPKILSLSFFVCVCVYVCVCVFLLFLWAAPTAYGGSQARGLIGAVAPGLCQSHSNVGSEPRLQPTPQLMATPDR